MWQQPHRPKAEITQNFSDGVVTIFSVSDKAEPGYKSKEKLVFKASLRYEERRLGIQRYYAGKQNQAKIQRVIRTPRAGIVSNQDVAVTEDGRKYRIDLVQTTQDVFPPSQDLTLVDLEQDYEVSV